MDIPISLTPIRTESSNSEWIRENYTVPEHVVLICLITFTLLGAVLCACAKDHKELCSRNVVQLFDDSDDEFPLELL